MTIEQIKCRAEITVGNVTVVTPFIQSFNVRKQRGQVSTFDASLKLLSTEAEGFTGASGDVIIKAGEDSSLETIFIGICRQAKITPCFDDPSYVIVSIGGADKLSLLQGKKFTRRCRTFDSTWYSITGVIRKGLKSGKFAADSQSVLEFNTGRMEKQNNVTGTRGVVAPKAATPPNGESYITPTIDATHYTSSS